jgi:hypothetical protein
MTWITWNLVSVQDGCSVCANRTIGKEINLDERDGTPRFEVQVEAHFSLFWDGADLDAGKVHGLCRKYHWLGNCFGCIGCNSKVTWVMWNLVLVHFKTV